MCGVARWVCVGEYGVGVCAWLLLVAVIVLGCCGFEGEIQECIHKEVCWRSKWFCCYASTY